MLEIDYTPYRYLLAVRDLTGAIVFARVGYTPADAPPAAALSAAALRAVERGLSGGWAAPLLRIGLGVAAAAGAVLLLLVATSLGLDQSGASVMVLFGMIGFMVACVYLIGAGLIGLAHQMSVTVPQGEEPRAR